MRQSRGGSGVGGGGGGGGNETLAAHAISMARRCRRPCLRGCRCSPLSVSIRRSSPTESIPIPGAEPSRADASYASRDRINVAGHRAEPIRTSLRPPRSMCRPRDTIRAPAIIAVRGERASCSRRNRSHQSPPALNSQARITPSALIAPRFYDLFYFFFFFWLFVSSLDKSFFEREEKRVYGIMLCIREGDAR